MTNPWLEIPATDYDGHMAAPSVGQDRVLSHLFGRALAEFRPPSVAVVGCATGNGLERVDPAVTPRVVGIDLNPHYLHVTGQRFGAALPGLELVHRDIASPTPSIEPVSLVFAALVFEYVDVPAAVRHVADCIVSDGVLVAALQLPSPHVPRVSHSPYPSLRALLPIMNLVPPARLAELCARHGLALLRAERVPLKEGKALSVGYFRKAPAPRDPR